MAIEKADDSSVIRDWARGGREIGRRLAAAGRSVTGVTYSYGTVQQVGTTGTLDILIDGDDTVRRGLKMTTACRGAAAGDRVLVLKSGRLSTVTGVLAHDNDPSVKGCLISQEICQASFTSVPVGEFRNASVKFSLSYERTPIVIPVSTGWLVTNEATNVTTTGFTANAVNWSNGTHSGNAKYLVLGFK